MNFMTSWRVYLGLFSCLLLLRQTWTGGRSAILLSFSFFFNLFVIFFVLPCLVLAWPDLIYLSFSSSLYSQFRGWVWTRRITHEGCVWRAACETGAISWAWHGAWRAWAFIQDMVWSTFAFLFFFVCDWIGLNICYLSYILVFFFFLYFVVHLGVVF